MNEKNMKIIPPHSDVFGYKAMTESEIIRAIEEFSSLTIIHMCTKLMLFLCSEGAQNPDKQTELALGLLNQETRERLQAYIEKGEAEGAKFVLFHHVPVMMMLKLNLEHNDETGLEITDEATRTKFVSILYSLADIWMNETRLTSLIGDGSQRRTFIDQFRAYSARQYLLEVGAEPMINQITRGRALLDIVRKDTRIPFDDTFKSATGLELDMYLEIMLMIAAQWTVAVDLTKLDEMSVRTTTEYFKHTTLKEADIEAFLKIVGFDKSDYKSLNQDYLSKIDLKDGLTNFITFMNKPVLRYDDKFLCLSPDFLLLQFTEGPYNIVREALKGTKYAERLPQLWGDAYEEYALARLDSIFGKANNKKLKDNDGKESIDALIDLGDVALMVEVKYPHWSFKARTTGQKKDMHNYLERIVRYRPIKEKLGQPKVDKKKGLGQIKYFVEKADDGRLVPPFKLEGKFLVPVLILGEGFPPDSFNREFIESYAGTEGCLISKDERLMPFILITSEELELIESLKETIGLDDTQKLLMGYVIQFDPKTRPQRYVERPSSFKNDIINRKISVPNSKYLKDRSKAEFDPVRKYFKKGEAPESVK